MTPRFNAVAWQCRAEAVNFIKDKVEHLPREERVREIMREEIGEALQPIATRLSHIESELADINRRLDALEEPVGSIKGYKK